MVVRSACCRRIRARPVALRAEGIGPSSGCRGHGGHRGASGVALVAVGFRLALGWRCIALRGLARCGGRVRSCAGLRASRVAWFLPRGSPGWSAAWHGFCRGGLPGFAGFFSGLSCLLLAVTPPAIPWHGPCDKACKGHAKGGRRASAQESRQSLKNRPSFVVRVCHGSG